MTEFTGFPECYPDCNCEPWATGLIHQPWAFWTTFAYLFTALWVYRRFGFTDRTRSWFVSLFLVTLGSFLAHARFDVLSLAIDEAAVTLLISVFHFPIFKSWGKTISICFTVTAFLTITFYFVPITYWDLIVSLVFTGAIGLAIKRFGLDPFVKFRFLGILALYGCAFLFFAFDKSPILCDLPNVPYGHSVWHLGSAFSAALFATWWFGELTSEKPE